MVVKGIYVTWAHDPQNPRIKDWNVMELKVGFSLPRIIGMFLTVGAFADRRTQTSCGQIRCGTFLEIYRHLDADEQAMADAGLSVSIVASMHDDRFSFSNLCIH